MQYVIPACSTTPHISLPSRSLRRANASMPWRFWTRLAYLSPSSSVCERLLLTTSDELVFSSLPYRPAPFLRGWHVSHRGPLATSPSFIGDLFFVIFQSGLN